MGLSSSKTVSAIKTVLSSNMVSSSKTVPLDETSEYQTAVTKYSNIKHLDWILQTPKQFTSHYDGIKSQLQKEMSNEEYDIIIYDDKHHILKMTRTHDFSLPKNKLNELIQSGIVFHQLDKPFTTFPCAYLEMYNNDMPVFITSDSMLYALHRYYDEWLMDIERNLLSILEKVCENALNEIGKMKSLELTDHQKKLLKDAELYFAIPFVVMNIERELEQGETLSTSSQSHISKEELISKSRYLKLSKYGWDSFAFDNDNKDRYYDIVTNKIVYDIDDLPDLTTKMKDYEMELPDIISSNDRKLKKIIEYYGLKPSTITILMNQLMSSKFWNKLYNEFQDSNFNSDSLPTLNFASQDELITIFNNISSLSDFRINDTEFDGSLFKPRGHYTKSFILRNYYKVFTWFSTYILKIETTYGLNIYNLQLAVLLSKLTDSSLKNFDDIINDLIGDPDLYSSTTLLKLLSDKNKNPIETATNDHILENLVSLLDKKCKTPKYGDTTDNVTKIGFATVCKVNTIDNEAINGVLSSERLYPSIFDIIYTVMKNESVKEIIDDNMKKIGINYSSKLEKTKQSIVIPEEPTIFNQTLKMLASLTHDKNNTSPFNTSKWHIKQANTQIGNYTELKRDNQLYTEEYFNMQCMCSHPDIMIEPVPTFWNEYKNTVGLLLKISNKLQKNTETLQKMITITDKFLEFLSYDDSNIPEELEVALKSIMKLKYRGSGSPVYEGWYANLFTDKTLFDFEPVTTSIASYPPDYRSDGGIVNIGTGKVQLMYIIVNNRAFIGPVYTTYEFRTEWGVRYTDKEWEKKLSNYKPLDIV